MLVNEQLKQLTADFDVTGTYNKTSYFEDGTSSSEDECRISIAVCIPCIGVSSVSVLTFKQSI